MRRSRHLDREDYECLFGGGLRLFKVNTCGDEADGCPRLAMVELAGFAH
jgi:hypothetical protein